MQPSLRIDIDTEGYSFPTSMAFVPRPGPEPGGPLYFVTELGGTVKVVSNNRAVTTFADVQSYLPAVDFRGPDGDGGAGLAGICLAPDHGYVFVTFAAFDEDGVLRNNIVRFETQPDVFAPEPTGMEVVGLALTAERSAVSHQVGGCTVADGSLYVGVGDAFDAAASQQIGRLLGKVLRLTFDGAPHPDNPFFSDESEAARYVWAYGFRNPFSIAALDGELFVADNGLSLDRFTRVEKGLNYLWDGSELSIGAAADAVMSPAVGPVQMKAYPGGATFFPQEFRNSFYVAASAASAVGVVAIPYDSSAQRVVAPPSQLVRYIGNEIGQMRGVTGIGVGADGLYFVPIMPNAAQQTPVYRVSYAPENAHPFIIGSIGLFSSKGCLGCHSLGDEGGLVGPTLLLGKWQAQNRIEEMLASGAYAERLGALDLLTDEPFVSTRVARREVLEANDADRLQTYIRNKILEPRFDNPASQMPQLGLTPEEASEVTAFLLSRPEYTLAVQLRSWLPFAPTRKGDVMAGAVVGVAVGLALSVSFAILWRVTRGLRAASAQRWHGRTGRR